MSKIPKPVVIASKGAAVLLLLAAAVGGGYLARGVKQEMEGPSASAKEAKDEKEQEWTCSMHPSIKRTEPGQCPICGMDLVPVSKGGADGDGRPSLVISDHARKLAEIQTTPVQRKFVRATVRLVGKVDFDETRVENITAWVPGRLDRLFVDYTGVPVKKGDHMVSLYSPELISAQEELLQARDALRDIEGSNMESVTESSRRTLEAAREKLLLWGLKEKQLQKIEQSGKPVDHLTIYAPRGGIVLKKHKNEGDYVKTGDPIYTIADLSHVWVKLDAYESDMKWVRYGQPVSLTTEAYPGETFEGRIAFIAPVLNEKTRTVKLRIDAKNPQGKLKPGMFVRATVKPRLAASGQVMSQELSGKWICRMHPGVVNDESGDCDICGMPLVRTEALGYVSEEEVAEKPLVIPTTAPLITGKRAVVYVQVPDTNKPTYEGREVVLGPRADEYYIVESGLEADERVVTQGNFKIDSALQIQAKSSMMSADGEEQAEAESEKKSEVTHLHLEAVEAPQGFKEQLAPLVPRYLEVQKTLAEDAPEKAAQAAQTLLDVLSGLKHEALKETAHKRWMDVSSTLEESAGRVSEANELQPQREAFSNLSTAFRRTIQSFGPLRGEPLYLHYCPMAFDNQGAFWVQSDKDTLNPYFGSAMLKCGEVRQRFPGAQEGGDGE